MDYCMRNAGPGLANMIMNVEDDGDTIDCCEDNKFFTMICEGPATTTTPAPPAPAPAEESPPPEEEPAEEEPEEEEEPEGTTTTTTTTEDLMARIERMAKEYGLVPEDEEEGGDGDGGDGGDGKEGGGGGDGDADSAAAGGAGGAAPDGAAGSMAMDKSAKATADQVRDQNDMRLAANEEEVPPRKMG